MKLPAGDWMILEEATSTQDVAAQLVRDGGSVPAVVLAKTQTAGRGRLGRTWLSPPGGSLAASIPFLAETGHPKPWLLGMALGCAAAGVLHCRIRWPNDLVVGGRKVGGILTELVVNASGSLIPVVGIGINTGPMEFPEDLVTIGATLEDGTGGPLDPVETLRRILDRAAGFPDPRDWSDLEPIWRLFDDTPGKRYRTPAGEEATAIGLGADGELLALVNGESISIRAADAFFGT